jgi:hypothetical protein
VPGTDPPTGHRRGWTILLLATAAAIGGFWGAGSADGQFGTIGVLAVPLYWAAGNRLGWWAPPWPLLALVVGVALGAATGSNDNEYAWMNYAAGLVFCQTAVVWGLVQRGRAER